MFFCLRIVFETIVFALQSFVQLQKHKSRYVISNVVAYIQHAQVIEMLGKTYQHGFNIVKVCCICVLIYDHDIFKLFVLHSSHTANQFEVITLWCLELCRAAHVK